MNKKKLYVFAAFITVIVTLVLIISPLLNIGSDNPVPVKEKEVDLFNSSSVSLKYQGVNTKGSASLDVKSQISNDKELNEFMLGVEYKILNNSDRLSNGDKLMVSASFDESKLPEAYTIKDWDPEVNEESVIVKEYTVGGLNRLIADETVVEALNIDLYVKDLLSASKMTSRDKDLNVEGMFIEKDKSLIGVVYRNSEDNLTYSYTNGVYVNESDEIFGSLEKNEYVAKGFEGPFKDFKDVEKDLVDRFKINIKVMEYKDID